MIFKMQSSVVSHSSDFLLPNLLLFARLLRSAGLNVAPDQLADLGDLFGAPSWDTAGKTFNDTVLVKASRGVGLERVSAALSRELQGAAPEPG